MLHGLGEKLADHAGGMAGEGEDAGQGPEAHRRHEDHAPDQPRDRAQHAEEQPHGAAEPRLRRDVARSQGAERQRGENAEHGAGDAHRERFEQRLTPFGPAAEIRRHGVGGKLQHGRQRIGIAARIESAGIDERPSQSPPSRRSS